MISNTLFFVIVLNKFYDLESKFRIIDQNQQDFRQSLFEIRNKLSYLAEIKEHMSNVEKANSKNNWDSVKKAFSHTKHAGLDEPI